MLYQLLRNPSPMTAFMILVYLAVLMTALPFHEFAHGWVANKLGDPTAKNMGRLDLNPFKHLDMFGTVLFLITGFGFAKPVPVDPRYFKNRRAGMALTALAGPVSNILLAWIVMVVYKVLALFLPLDSQFIQLIFQVLSVMISLNLGLAVFNLIPIPPLDGSKILGYFLSERISFKILQYQRYLTMGLFLAILLGVLDTPLFFLRSLLLRGIDFLTGFVDIIGNLIR